MKYKLSFLIAGAFTFAMFIATIMDNVVMYNLFFIGVLFFLNISLIETIIDIQAHEGEKQ